MIEKEIITDKELLFIKLQCNWSDISVRKNFAINGLYLNVLREDPNMSVQMTAIGRQIYNNKFRKVVA